MPVLADYEAPSLELRATSPVQRRDSVNVKLFVEFVSQRFAGEPEWDAALRRRGLLSNLRTIKDEMAKKPERNADRPIFASLGT